MPHYNLVVTLYQPDGMAIVLAVAGDLQQGEVGVTGAIVQQIGIHDTDSQPLALALDDAAAVEPAGPISFFSITGYFSPPSLRF